MVRRHTSALRASLMAADFIGAAVLFIVVSMVRFGPGWHAAWYRLGIDPFVAAVVYGLGWTMLVSLQGLYRVRARYALRSEALALVRAGAILGVAMVIYLFIERVSNASRLFIGSLLVATVAVAFAARVALRAT